MGLRNRGQGRQPAPELSGLHWLAHAAMVATAHSSHARPVGSLSHLSGDRGVRACREVLVEEERRAPGSVSGAPRGSCVLCGEPQLFPGRHSWLPRAEQNIVKHIIVSNRNSFLIEGCVSKNRATNKPEM